MISAKKKYDIRTINFGERGNPARVLVRQYVKEHGVNKLSELIRRLVFCYLSGKAEHKNWRVELLLFEREQLGEQVFGVSKRMREVEAELRKLGVDDVEWIKK